MIRVFTPADRKRSSSRVVKDAIREYGGEEEMPLLGYAALLSLYPVVFGTLLTSANRSQSQPDRNTPSVRDIMLLSVATHKIARLITKDWVTSPLRAAFTEYEESAGAGEVVEQSRGRGFRRAMGDLLTCPWCMGAWVATTLGLGYFITPRLTRMVATVFTIEAIADFLHIAYDSARARK